MPAKARRAGSAFLAILARLRGWQEQAARQRRTRDRKRRGYKLPWTCMTSASGCTGSGCTASIRTLTAGRSTAWCGHGWLSPRTAGTCAYRRGNKTVASAESADAARETVKHVQERGFNREQDVVADLESLQRTRNADSPGHNLRGRSLIGFAFKFRRPLLPRTQRFRARRMLSASAGLARWQHK